ncbi:hypothetical protein GWI33_002363 [Rhynchophorus ferrugineus]|uniref:HTH OST-type domain-containing protein n=1 Tax=Rhynchophorus ferrugineus TaxID=354439 RepID=A0A834IPH3_RHYFE|nr:hypothetical protein GWI33_002363 [Rhynchophorus ferrugineus]
MSFVTEFELKNIIRSLLTSSPCISDIKSLENDFVELVGYKLPFRQFKSKTAEEYLRTIPDVCRIEGTGSSARVLPVITAKSAHIDEFVTKQMNKDVTCPLRKRFTRNVSLSTNQSHRSYFGHNNYSKKIQGISISTQKPKASSIEAEHNNDIEMMTSKKTVPQYVQKNLQKLIALFEEGIWCADLPYYYKQMFKRDLPFSNFGYNALLNKCLELRHIFFCVKSNTGNFRLYGRSRGLPRNIPQALSDQSSSDLITYDNNLECIEDINEGRLSLLRTEAPKSRILLNTETDSFNMSIPEYDQWAKGCTDTSSVNGDATTSEENNNNNVHSNIKNDGNSNNEYERFEMNYQFTHKSNSIQNDGREATVPQKVLRPPPGFTVPMYRHLVDAANRVSYSRFYLDNPPACPCCLASLFFNYH